MDIGIQPDQDVLTAYNDLKNKKTYQYLIMKVTDDNKSIVLDKAGEPGSSYDDFLASLPETEPRYCVFDYHHEFSDGRKTNKIVYIFWSPDGGKVQRKMVCATNNTNFQGKL